MFLLLCRSGREGSASESRYLKILEYYSKALQIYSITHGTEIPFVKGLISKISEFEQVCKTAGFVPTEIPQLPE